MSFSLRYLRTELPLLMHELTIGRGAECGITLDDGLVSRRHARLEIRGRHVVIEDLGSHNGVMVNGQRIPGPTQLRNGDRIVIGSIELELVERREASLAALTVTAGVGGAIRAVEVSLAPPDEPTFLTRRPEAFELLGGVVERALAAGAAEEAGRLLGGHLGSLIAEAQRGSALPPETCAAAARVAVKVAAATGRGVWVDHAIALFAAARHLMPAVVSEEMLRALPKLAKIDVKKLRDYVGAMRSPSADRLALGRLEELERGAMMAHVGKG